MQPPAGVSSSLVPADHVLATGEIIATLVLIFFLALCSFFFSASETAVIALSKIRLRNLVVKGSKAAASVQRLVTKFDKFIAAILIGNDFVNIAISAIITGIFVHWLGYRLGVALSTVISTAFVLIACEITPKILAMKRCERIALLTGPFMELFIRIFHPIILVFTGISNALLKLLRIPPAKRSPLITEEELRTMIEVGKEEGVLTDEERRMLHHIFEFGDTLLSDVMVPKDRIVAVSSTATPEELLDTFAEKGHSRIPVYEGSLDTIIGVVYTRDLLYFTHESKLFVLQDLIQNVVHALPDMRVNALLRQFQAEKIQIAIVVDKQHRTIGLVTLEDLIEEIVGELEEKPSQRLTRKK